MLKNILFVCLCLTQINCLSQTKASYETLQPINFQLKLKQSQKYQLIDVRTSDEFAVGKILDARNIDFLSSDFANKLSKLDKNQPIYVYCKVGGRSAKACEKMNELGFKKIYNLAGGIENWKKNIP